MNESSKVICGCHWKGTVANLLRAPHPFAPGHLIYACPECKDIRDSTEEACQEPECWESATSGTPYPGGYKRHCHKHPPMTKAIHDGLIEMAERTKRKYAKALEDLSHD